MLCYRKPELPLPTFNMNQLPNDLILHILEFADIKTNRTVASSNSVLRSLVLDSQYLLRQQIQQEWAWLTTVDHTTTVLPSNLFQCLALARASPHEIDDSLLYQKVTKIIQKEKVVYRFMGDIGRGDRCIRAKQALTKPRYVSQRQFLFATTTPQALPFCAPFFTTTTSPEQKLPVLVLTPRLTAYFEIAIQPSSKDPNECVAIGIANSRFPLHSRLPGWDHLSFGYHGDDGGIFHAGGHMIKQYGPKFGPGDVVGCGMDYLKQEIFFTLNGTFLGKAFAIDKKMIHDNWYPVVGMDTHAFVESNFTGPFAFDLHHYILTQHSQIQQLIK